MNDKKKKLTGVMHSLASTGFFSVFFSSTICKILSFFGGMIIVRVLTKAEYGEYGHIMNCFGMLSLLGDLGFNSATMQCCNESHQDPNKRDSYFIIGYIRGIAFTLLTCIALLVSPLFYPYRSPEAAKLTQWLCLLPLIQTTNSFLSINLRVRMENSRYALINVFQSVTTYLVILPASYWIGIKGAVLSEYVINTLVLLFSLFISRKQLGFTFVSSSVSKSDRKSLFKLAFGTQLNNGVSKALSLLDVFLIGIFVVDAEVISSYKVATTIPLALAFIPSALAIYIVPFFSRNRTNITWVKNNYYKLTFLCGIGNLLITIGLIALSPFLIPLIFGTQYTDAIACFCILMVGYFFSATFSVISSNIIYTQRKVRANIIITALSGISSCILNVVLIPLFGPIGASVAATLVNLITALLNFGYMIHYIHRANRMPPVRE